MIDEVEYLRGGISERDAEIERLRAEVARLDRDNRELRHNAILDEENIKSLRSELQTWKDIARNSGQIEARLRARALTEKE